MRLNSYHLLATFIELCFGNNSEVSFPYLVEAKPQPGVGLQIPFQLLYILSESLDLPLLLFNRFYQYWNKACIVNT